MPKPNNSVNPHLNSKKKRSTFLINPEFQFRFLGFQLMSSLLTAIVFYVANSYFFAKMAAAGAAVGLPEQHVFFKFIGQQEQAMGWIFVMAAGATTILLSLVGIYYSHKIAGPLFNLQKFIQDHTFKKRAEKQLKFREKDFFPELAQDVNLFMQEWNTKKNEDSAA